MLVFYSGNRKLFVRGWSLNYNSNNILLTQINIPTNLPPTNISFTHTHTSPIFKHTPPPPFSFRPSSYPSLHRHSPPLKTRFSSGLQLRQFVLLQVRHVEWQGLHSPSTKYFPYGQPRQKLGFFQSQLRQDGPQRSQVPASRYWPEGHFVQDLGEWEVQARQEGSQELQMPLRRYLPYAHLVHCFGPLQVKHDESHYWQIVEFES